MSLTPVEIESLVREMVFGSDSEAKQQQIREMAFAGGMFFASIQNLYDAIGKGEYKGFTVPAINLRGLTFDMAKAIFRAAIKNNVGPFIFEIARSEQGYTSQPPGEFSAAILAAGLVEGYKGPVFIQADHTQFNRKNYAADPRAETDAIKKAIRDNIEAGFYNIDIDASTLVDINQPDLLKQQQVNGSVTAEMTRYIRSIQPDNVTVSVGGEIGEIGAGNSTEGDLRAFMEQYRKFLGDVKGISKISVQTGTTHGGVVLPDGSIAKVQLDFDTLEKLSRLAREEYGMGGAVQHGASTLPDEMFDIFPQKGCLEVHLATGYQNIIFDSPEFPQDLMQKMQAGMDAKYAADKKAGETDTQFYYKTRKRAFGDFKKEIWSIPPEKLAAIMKTLEDQFTLTFKKLNVVNTRPITDKLIRPA